jgi:hypothetical protein
MDKAEKSQTLPELVHKYLDIDPWEYRQVLNLWVYCGPIASDCRECTPECEGGYMHKGLHRFFTVGGRLHQKMQLRIRSVAYDVLDIGKLSEEGSNWNL